MLNKGAIIATVAIGFCMLFSMYLLGKIISADTFTLVHQTLDWIQTSPQGQTGNTADSSAFIRGGILLDRLACVMLVVITLVSFLVHLFSIKPTQAGIRHNRYYLCLFLFTVSMMGLVVADNLLFLFIFWELVGLCSYLLIGHWYEKPSACKVATKAFIATKLCDLGMILAMVVCFKSVGSLQFVDIFNAISSDTLSGTAQTLLGLGLFVAAIGKGAQFPLHFWLPDATEEGPTPVSALIHSATMVSAGVYLLARMFPVLDNQVLLYIAYTGAGTALFGAILATVQDNIKRVLAYSTISQLGTMFLGIGVGAYSASIFHLTTHAFFKAGLFLGAGAIIYAVHNEQSIQKFGGLYKKMPKIACCYLLLALAAIGFPPFSGFWSNGAVLDGTVLFTASGEHGFLLYGAFIVVFLTAFYMARLFFLIFTGKPRDQQLYDNATDSPLPLFIPIAVLSFLAVIAGGVWSGSWFAKLYPQISLNQQIISIVNAENNPISNLSSIAHIGATKNSSWVTTVLSIMLSLGGIGVSSLFYFQFKRFNGHVILNPPAMLAKPLYWVGSLCNTAIKWLAIATNAFGRFIATLDTIILDRFIASGGIGVLRAVGGKLSVAQSGYFRNCLLFTVVGIIILAIAMTN